MSFATPLLPCCRAAARRASSRRTLATAAASASSSSASTSTPPKTYKRPVKAGVSPIYDSALAYIEQDRQEKLQQLATLRKQLDSPSTSGRRRLQDEILGLEIASEINDPETRWRFQQGQSNISKPVYRYLAEQAWRKNGRLGLLMQRIAQMNIVPDLAASIDPDVDLQVHIEAGEVVPGVFLKPEQTISAPALKVQVFHPEERLYTLLMVDPDSPDPGSDTFKTVCHWAICNIPLDGTNSSISSGSSTLQDYIPPHPQKGTPYHRYTFLLYEQQSGTIETASIASSEEGGFDTRSFASQHSLVPRGVHFFRQKWDESVSKIYQDILKMPEPTFGRPKKIDRYKPVEE